MATAPPGPALTVADRSFISADAAGRKNMLQLIQLRWLAVSGQLLTILFTRFVLDVHLPLLPLLTVSAALVVLNLLSIPLLRREGGVNNATLFLALLLDVAALTAQLYWSGGATNPFISLFLLQVVLSAVLLDTRSTWIIVALTSFSFAFLTIRFRPLPLPPGYGGDLFGLYIRGAWICFALIATLLVLFVTRITKNLRARDAHLAEIRQQAVEEDHIVRMGLLASGAAHELGTPLSSLSVILSDWKRMPLLAQDPELLQEIDEMQAELARCKAIVTGILMSAGEARGEAPVVTTVRTFLDDIVSDWRAARGPVEIAYDDMFGDDQPIISDSALKQVICNVLDNAVEASPRWVGFSATRQDGSLVIAVSDHGPGFRPEMLSNLGKPYQSSKNRAGGGIGLFLVNNVMRKLGGRVDARNDPAGGAVVTLTLPLAALALGEEDADGA